MTHKEALNLILSHACPAELLPDDVRTFNIELHCVQVTITARLIATVDTIQYEILSVDFGEE